MAERGTNRPTEAEVKMLNEMAMRGFPSIQAHLGLVAAVCEDWLRTKERLHAILSRSRWATWNSADERLEPRFSESEFLELTHLAGIDANKCELTQDQED